MAFIGNTVQTQGFVPAIDTFSGNGSTTAFTLSRPVASVAQVECTISNVPQDPNAAYTVSGNTITFTSAPPSGTNNIYVRYTSLITQTIAPSQGTVGTAQLGTITNIASGNSPLTLQTGSSPTTAVTIDTSQNVGIGTSNPKSKLTLGGSNASQSLVFDNTGSNSGSRLAMNIGYSTTALGSSTVYQLIQAQTGLSGYDNQTNLSFWTCNGTTPNQNMTLDQNGNLSVVSNISTSGGSSSFNANTGSTSINLNAQNAAGANCIINMTCPGSNSGYIQYQRSGSQLQVVSQSGGVYLGATATSWSALSDERFKENLVPINEAIRKVNSLRAVTGNYISDETKKSRSFLIAQDVQAVLPEAVDKSNPDQLGLAYSDVIPLLVAAIQEQQALITDLTTRLAALEAK